MRKITFPICLAFVALPAIAVAQQHANLSRGLSPEKLYDTGGIDSINVFNGGLTLSIPIGPSYPVNASLSYSLGLHYNSKIWDYRERFTQTETYLQALPHLTSNAGIGWMLTLGELLPPNSAKNNTGVWVYLSPDGAEHRFFSALVPGQTVVAGVCYTRDLSYLRLKGIPSCTNANSTSATIEYPDGTKHTFNRASAGATVPFLLTEIRDRFNNVITVNQSSSTLWTLTDPHRQQRILFKASQQGWVVDKVELTSPAGTAPYNFTYTDMVIDRSCDDNDPQTSPQITMSMLTSIALPDGSAYTMDAYETVCGTSAGADGPGLLEQITLPTRGKMQYQYGVFDFPQRFAYDPEQHLWYDGIGQQTGVSSKTLLDAAGAVIGSFTYAPTAGSFPNYDRQVVVTSPIGDQTVNWFVDNDQSTEYGLPMKKSVNDGSNRFLSTEIYDGLVSGGQKRRSNYLRYDGDSCPALGVPCNKRVGGRRTTFEDDPGKWAAVEHSNWDGLGHYRATDTSGNFDSANVRSEFTGWTGVQPATTAPWLLNTFWDSQAVEGPSAIRNLNCFDPATGAINRRRVLKNTGALSADDLLIEYVRDVAGNVISERHYGGDNQALLSISDTCVFTLPSPAYRIDNTYQYGALRTSQHFGAGFLDVDYDLDPGTGLPVASRDTALVATTYEYDDMNRPIWVRPAQDAWVSYAYTKAAGAGSASVRIRQYPNGSAANALTEEIVEFDPFGRVYREKRRTPSGVWAKRTTFYTAMGWKSNISEWQQDGVAHTALTNFMNFDPFGRPTTIRPPDGSAHDVTLSYAGVRSVTRTTKVATGAGGAETSSTTTEIYDRQGRLYRVIEPSGAAGANVTTTYGYDAAGRLKSASTPSGSTQNRTFTYDARGFLTSECHPEKGVSGNGCVTYSLYDARGHAGRKVDGSNQLRFFYDAAERLFQVNNDATGQAIKVFSYGSGTGAADRSRGKVKTAVRYNQIGAPFNATAAITETYTYGGDQGRVSMRETNMTFNGSPGEAFRQTFAWNDLGDLSSQTYPDCIAICAPATPRTVSYGYTDGRVTSIPGFVTSATYHLSGLVNIVNRANGTWDQWTPQTTFTGRVQSIAGFTNNWNPVPFGLWTSGTFEYDGAGNVKKMGNATFTYDKVSRLIAATVYPGSYSNGTPQNESYSFDSFGNMQSKTTNGVTLNTPTSSATNRLTGASYDGAGSQTSWNGATYQYDAMSMMTKMLNGAEDWRYVYTADDERFWSYRVGGGGSLWTLRGLDGKVLRSYNAHLGWSNVTDYVYREGTLTASVTNGVVNHLHTDHLGTPRLVSTPTGGADQVTFHSYYPFGEEITFGSAYADRLRFTSHERDLANVAAQADDLDYMLARHRSALTTRFLSFDPIGGNTFKPQSWNRYAYVLGNPINFTDPLGLLPGPCPSEAPKGAYCEDVVTTDRDPLHDVRVQLDLWWNVGGPILESGVAREFGAAAAREAQLQIAAQSGDQLAMAELGLPVVGAVDNGAGPLEFGALGLSSALVRSLGSAGAQRAFIAATEFLGAEARVISNSFGDKIFLSKDGLRRIRFDIKHPYPHKSPHAHIDHLVNGKWRPFTGRYGRQIYPRGVPPE